MTVHPSRDRSRMQSLPRKLAARSSCAWQPGFTLIEMVISAALMALILVSAYACLNACLASQKMIEPRADVLQNARVAMALMTADLRDACPLSPSFALLGTPRMLGKVEADNLDFATHNYTPRRPHEGNFCEVSYFVDQDPQTGQLCLYRRQNPTLALDPLSGGKREEIAQNVLGVRFEYFDGEDWYDSWGSTNSIAGVNPSSELPANDEDLPEAVRITLMFDSDPPSQPAASSEQPSGEPPLVFQTVVRLALANRPQSGVPSGGDSVGATLSGM